MARKNKSRRFAENQIISWKSKKYQCIICNHKLAVFGLITGTVTSYQKTFVVSNNPTLEDGFEYKLVS